MKTYKPIKIYAWIQAEDRFKTLQEKLIANIIWSWQSEGKCCFTSNEHIAELLVMSPGEVHELIKSMERRLLIKQYYPTSTRFLKIVTGQDIDCSTDLNIFEI